MKNSHNIGGIIDEESNMLAITISLHPLSATVLRAQYGADRIVFRNHDTTFDLITGMPQRRKAPGTDTGPYKSQVTLVVTDSIARTVRDNQRTIADRLYRHHKELMCWYVASAVKMKGNRHAKAAIAEWFQMHGVSEDDFSMDAAYKSWQRFQWNFQKKNREFAVRLRDKAAGELSRKRERHAKAVKPVKAVQWGADERACELALARFLSSFDSNFKRMPVKLPRHARIYIYKVYGQLSVRQAAARLSITPNGVHHAVRALQSRMKANPTIQRLMDEAIAYKADLPAAQ